jgi:FAD/FMN-containing dehydrogenase
MTHSNSMSTPAQSVARSLQATMSGSVLLASDEAYSAARRIWNGAVDRRPAIIARCANPDDVQTAVRTAREHGLPLSVRGGGHDWAGRALRDGGLVIDLSAMRRVTIDVDSRTALVEGGVRAGDLVAAARRYGLAPATGTVKSVGMAGLTLAGGYGPLNGRAGLALDNLLGAEVVLADGRRVLASDGDDADDLYWALRGGGGNFGVTTALRYRLHPISSVLAGLVLFSATEALAVLRGYRELVAQAPDELTVMTGFIQGPDDNLMLFLSPTWSGGLGEGEPLVAKIANLGTPLSVQIAKMAYEDLLGLFDAQVIDGRHYALQTRWLATLTDDAAAALLEAARGATSPFSAIAVHHFHGAASRVPVAETAFAMRQDHLLIEILAAWEPTAGDDGAIHRRWACGLSDQLAPHALPGGYPNLLGADENERVRLAYGANWTRLLQLKRRFDPDNIFTSATPTLVSAG